MASFELKSNSCDGHIRALSRAILMASKISKEGLLEFTADKMRLCARTDILLIKFVFTRGFFTEYTCDSRHRCFINLKALSMPFRSSVLVSDREGTLRSTIKIRCQVEDILTNQIVFKIGGEPPSTTLTYRLSINDLDPDKMRALNAINRTIDYSRVEMIPKHCKKERFLLSAFNSFAPDIDQVTIKSSQSEVRFIGSISPACQNRSATLATSEFTHKRSDFEHFEVREDTNITVPLRHLKVFLNFVETNKVQTSPRYVFEGMGFPAHFIYNADLFKAHFVSQTPMEFIPDELDIDRPLPICFGGPNESFIADENVIQADDVDENFEAYYQNAGLYEGDDDDLDEDGYNDNQSEASDLLDGNLDGLIPSADQSVFPGLRSTTGPGTGYGNESIRGEMLGHSYDPEKIKEILEPNQNPDDIENVVILYSSDED